MTRPAAKLDNYLEGCASRDRAWLGRAITLVESRRRDHQKLAQTLLQRLMPKTGQSRRIGITGVPGVGKSTLIDAFGSMLIDQGHKLAVLAVDPSSQRHGGSILGDKTRMANLAANEHAFIRPSPSSGTLGGVGRMTREAIFLCEAWGFDVVLVETVGVGQSEVMVSDMVDIFIALMLPGGGDELQGIKKGVIEVADLIAINKADGQLKIAADQARTHYQRALHILEPQSPNWTPPVVTLSALTGQGLPELWQLIEQHRQKLQASGEFMARRQSQQVHWFRGMLEVRLMSWLRSQPHIAGKITLLELQVRSGEIPASYAAAQILDILDDLPSPNHS